MTLAAPLALALAACGDEQTFTVSNVDRAEVAEGEHEIDEVTFSENGDWILVRVVLDSDGTGPCNEMGLGFCARDAGKKLTLRPEDPSVASGKSAAPCTGDGYVPAAIHGSFSSYCGVVQTWTMTHADAQVDLDGDEAHVVLSGTLAQLQASEGGFDVDVDVVATPVETEAE